ncbi:MAG: dihydrofolate reductase, partial [Prevotella buccalis]|nr:dihydrofolate reductase [Hoylesella buccalis]
KFDPKVMPKRVNQADGEDLVMTSAANYYEGVTQDEAEKFYAMQKVAADPHPVMYGMNSRLVKKDGVLQEEVWKLDGMYGEAIQKIIFWLEKAETVAENEAQREVIRLLIDFYRTGDLKTFDTYSIAWLKDTDSKVDFVNGFIESYGDPLGMKASWESIVNFKDEEATHRTEIISQHAQWFEDHSPVEQRFKKEKVKGVTAHVICAAMLGGDEYPSSAIGINLPNAEWIRARYGSKSVTIGNLTEAYNHVGRGNGLYEEFVIDDETLGLINRYGDLCDDLHTDLHECLGHGSGRLLPGVDGDALGAYGDTIEEARADLFGLYYIADEKLIELGLLPNADAYKSQYYTYMMNGLLTQMVRIKEGHQIEEAHMRNRALIARWVLAHADGEVVIIEKQGVGGDNAVRHFVQINDYQKLRQLFAKLLAEIQRIKSEGDFKAARAIVERYAIDIDADLHREVLSRYQKLNIAPYKGFINPWMKPQYDDQGSIVDIQLDYTESYAHQMMRYSKTAESDE